MSWTDALAVDPALLAGVAVAVGGVAWCRRRATAMPARWRTAALLAGAAVLVVAWLSPLQTIGVPALLTAHLVQLLLITGLAAPLLLLGLPASLRTPLRPSVARLLRVGGHPVSGMLALNAVLLGWHVPAVYDAALRWPWLGDVEQLTFLLASLMFWWPIVVPLGGARIISRWATLGYILVATIPQTFAGITIALAKHVVYAPYASAPRLLGMSALTDQQVAGASLALVSKVALFTAFTIVFLRMLSDDPTAADDDDGGGGGGGRRRPVVDSPTPAPSGCVPWLADLNAGRTVPEPAPRIRQPAGR
ncbi:MAG: cytochrome c oxidase assembly protein [Candidatus Dormibacteria bacterium]